MPPDIKQNTSHREVNYNLTDSLVVSGFLRSEITLKAQRLETHALHREFSKQGYQLFGQRNARRLQRCHTQTYENKSRARNSAYISNFLRIIGMFSCSKSSLTGLLAKSILVPFAKMRESRDDKNKESGAVRSIILRALQTLSSQKKAYQHICEETALSLQM